MNWTTKPATTKQIWGKASQVPHQMTTKHVGMSTWRASLFVAYKGDGNNQLYITSRDVFGHKWNEAQVIAKNQSEDAPSMVIYGDGYPFVVYQGTDNNLQLVLKKKIDLDYVDWELPVPIAGFENCDSPCLIEYGNSITMVCKNAKGQVKLGVYHLDKEKWETFDDLSIQGKPVISGTGPQVAVLAGEDLLIAWTDKTTGEITSCHFSMIKRKMVGKPLVAHNKHHTFKSMTSMSMVRTASNQVMLAWQEHEKSGAVDYIFYQYEPEEGSGFWTDYNKVDHNTRTEGLVALETFGNEIFLMTNRNPGGDNMYLSSCHFKQWYHQKHSHKKNTPKPGKKDLKTPPFEWQKQQELKGAKTDDQIGATAVGKHIHIFYKKPGKGDQEVSHARFNTISHKWDQQRDLDSKTSKGLAADVTADGKVALFILETQKYGVRKAVHFFDLNPLRKMWDWHLFSGGPEVKEAPRVYRSDSLFYIWWLIDENVYMVQTLKTQFETVLNFDHGVGMYLVQDNLIYVMTSPSGKANIAGTVLANEMEVIVGDYKSKGNMSHSHRYNYRFLEDPVGIVDYLGRMDSELNELAPVEISAVTDAQAVAFFGSPDGNALTIQYKVFGKSQYDGNGDESEDGHHDWSKLYTTPDDVAAAGHMTAVKVADTLYLFYYDESGQIKYTMAKVNG